MGRLRPRKVFYDNHIHYDAWKDIPTVDALCEKDNAFPVGLQGATIEIAKASGFQIEKAPVFTQPVHMGTMCKLIHKQQDVLKRKEVDPACLGQYSLLSRGGNM